MPLPSPATLPPEPVTPVSPPPTGTPPGPSPLRDTDGDGITDDLDGDIDGDGLVNELDPDPDGDGQPGYTLPFDPDDDPVTDPETGLPVLEIGSARGRICAPNGTTWVAGADITIITPGGAFQTTSNGDGWWQLDGLPPGTWAVVVTKGSFEHSYNVTIEDGVVTEQVFEECLEQGGLTIAVVEGAYDHVGLILTNLGLVVQTTVDGSRRDPTFNPNVNEATNNQALINFLSSPTQLAQHDVIFLNCGLAEGWLSTNQSQIITALTDYVNAGGSIYASDWAHFPIELMYPDRISFFGNNDAVFGTARVGDVGFIDGVVHDPAMAAVLGGNTAEINYTLNAWVAMSSIGPSTELLVDGTHSYSSAQGSGSVSAPLAVRFTAGSGRVIYSTFHQENGATDDMHRMLEEIVLSL